VAWLRDRSLRVHDEELPMARGDAHHDVPARTGTKPLAPGAQRISKKN